MTREEVIEVRQRLLDHRFQPISVFNWDHPRIPKKYRGKRPSESEWQRTVGMPLYSDVAQNTGVLTGEVYPLDIDVEDPAKFTFIEEWASADALLKHSKSEHILAGRTKLAGKLAGPAWIQRLNKIT